MTRASFRNTFRPSYGVKAPVVERRERGEVAHLVHAQLRQQRRQHPRREVGGDRAAPHASEERGERGLSAQLLLERLAARRQQRRLELRAYRGGRLRDVKGEIWARSGCREVGARSGEIARRACRSERATVRRHSRLLAASAARLPTSSTRSSGSSDGTARAAR